MEDISHHYSLVMQEPTMPQAMKKEEVRILFQLWNSALTKEDADVVAT